jgi:DNA polymerase-3 subunit gamma/tau
MLEVSETLKQKYAIQSSLASADFLVNCLNMGNQCDIQYKVSKNKRLTVELTLIKMCYINALVSVDAGKKKLKSENIIDNGALNGNHKSEFEVSKPLQNNPNTEIAKEPTSQNDYVVYANATNNLIEEQPTKEIQKPAKPVGADPANNGKPIALAKTKKLLTLNSIADGDADTTGNNLQQANDDPKYDGEVLMLNQQNIEKVWESYATQIPDEKRGLKIAFKSFKPVLDSATLSKIYVTVQSDIQKAQFDEVRLGLNNYISRRMGAFIEIEIVADKEVSGGAKPYTPKEKLERMIQKNPAIKIMQQKLGLELDYD